MTEEEKLEKEYAEKMHWQRLYGHKPVVMKELKQAYIAGAKAVLEKWRNCYLSCSSPYCAFPDVEVKGNLGQLEKINKSVDTNNVKC